MAADHSTPPEPANLLRELETAWLFLTRMAWPGRWFSTPIETAPLPELARAVRMFPLIGLVVGALGGAVLWGATQLGLDLLAAALFGLMAATLATGALHEDGLADVADGFGGGADRAKKLKIMHDSRIGSYGVLALLFAVGLKAALLGSFMGPGLAAGALIVAHVTSRAAIPSLMRLMSPARKSGLGQGAGQPSREGALTAALLGAGLAMLMLGLGQGLVAAALAGLGAAAVGWLAQRQIGGQTGDVLGAAQQVAEVLVLTGLAIAGRWA